MEILVKNLVFFMLLLAFLFFSICLILFFILCIKNLISELRGGK